MKIKIIDYGYDAMPIRAHYNDAGIDVRANTIRLNGNTQADIRPGEILSIPLGFGAHIPDGYAGFILPRSWLAKSGIVCLSPPIDSGYRGEIHAIVANIGKETRIIEDGERIGQLVISPIILAELATNPGAERGNGAFGSTGR